MSFTERLTRGIMDGQIKYWQHIMGCEECFEKHMEIIKHGSGNPEMVEALDDLAKEIGFKL